LLAILYQETEGNPLFVVETVRMRALAQHEIDQPGTILPPTVQAVIASRLTQLSPAAREVGSLAAVIGRAFTFTVLSQASSSDEDTVVRGLDELWRRRIIREQGGDVYDFGHDKRREGAYSALSAARRRLLHRRVAEALNRLTVEFAERFPQ
jgi:predicted ATPase